MSTIRAAIARARLAKAALTAIPAVAPVAIGAIRAIGRHWPSTTIAPAAGISPARALRGLVSAVDSRLHHHRDAGG
jgi:hypothetical protein